MAQRMLQRTLRDFLQETEDAIGSGRVDVALANCQSILASFPESLEAQRLLGEVYLAQGKLKEALHSFDWVLTNDPENVIAYCDRAMVSERMSDYDTALDCYQQAYELSRGNSQIRQEFNQLSAKAGQQGFMFSRAGLARLYMRGDLLSQAIQEWDAVLTATPDRLDARVGLLEVCWREGAFERVEQLATRILQDISGCVKALLLLAHVISPRDMTRAQELLRRAQALDPDQVMAQELFADLLASQPDNPFLKLLRKSPVLVGPAPAADTGTGGTAAMSSLAALSQWGNVEGARNDTTLARPKSEDDARSQNAPFAAWSQNNDGTSISGISAGAGVPPASSPEAVPLDQPVSNSISHSSWSLDALSQPAPSPSGDPEPWQLLQEALNGMPNLSTPSLQDEPTVGNGDAGSSAAPSASSSDLWEIPSQLQANAPSSSPSWNVPAESETASSSPAWNMSAENRSGELTSSPSWGVPADEKTSTSAPPDWLNMLTPDDRRQMSTAMPAINPSAQAAAPQNPQAAQSSPELQVVSEPEVALPSTASSPLAVPPEEKDEEPLFFAGDDSDEELPFGPAWLKSLGATVLDDEKAASAPYPAVSAPSSRQPEPEQSVQPAAFDVWKSAKQDTPAQVQSDPVMFDAPPVPQPASPAATRETSVTYEPAPQVTQPEAALPEVVSNPTSYTTRQAAQAEPQAPSALPEPTSPYASWETPLPEYDPVQPTTFEGWQSFDTPSAPSEPVEEADNTLLSTLEELELQLRSKGFIPMEPNSLASIAQTETRSDTTGALDSQEVQDSQPEPVQEKQSYVESPLPSSSTFSEPDHAAEQSSSGPLAANSDPVPPEPEIINAPVEPQWLRELRSTPMAVPAPAAQQEAWPVANGHTEAKASATFQASSVPPTAINTPVPHIESIPGVVFAPTPAPAPGVKAQQRPSEPLVRSNPFMDGELETTMKRPAVRLQSMYQRPAPMRETPSTPKARPVERKEPVVNKIVETSNAPLSYKDRLLKGYQHQLVGDYDEAMQEYRIIIRSAPELLGEVVSNMRALLKIAPRYSAGYRVLGDAYMRQGEYLQAMESYNRALTIAKKGKS